MAEEKKKNDDDKKKKTIFLSVEVALLGLLILNLSLIGLFGEGILGRLITFGLVFLFGKMFYLPLILGVYSGFLLFFKRKKPKNFNGLKTSSFIILILFTLIAASWNFPSSSIGGSYTYFLNRFQGITNDSFLVNKIRISETGGGFIGYSLYAVMNSFVGEIGSKITIILIISFCFFILLKDFVIKLYKKISKLFIKSNSKRQERKNKKGIEKSNQAKADVCLLSSEIREESNFTNKVNEKNKLTFDIFNDPLFDDIDDDNESEIKISKGDSTLSENKPFVDKVDKNINNNLQEELICEIKISKQNVNEVDIFEEDELEFYGEEEIQETKPKNPFVNSQINLQNKSNQVSNQTNPYDLLIDNKFANASIELNDEALENVNKINQKLMELNIKASVNNYVIGPCVTRYEIVPEIGVRVSSIVNIENDLKLALAAFQTRMEAPIPGKSAVGIEVANKKRYPVYLKEILTPYENDENKLLVGIGEDLNNEGVIINIDKLPHLLIAGATGSGKSVCINSIIVSLLIRSNPRDVKLLLVDPKKVEMTCYSDMPHLLCPVVKDPKKASVALKKVIVEMDIRYDLFANAGVKNIDGYNALMERQNKEKIYKIVIIIDELADLMMVASREVEESIQRLTQLARAAGIYLIVATQRPSVDVITGIIKANIPSRIAFGVSSSIDSRTIIDRSGAEKLLGKGDMLMDITGSLGLNRVQGAFVSDEEIKKIVDYAKNKYNLEYVENFINLEEENENKVDLLVENDTNDDIALYQEIKRFVIDTQKASTSLIQKQFSLGYPRASRMMDKLESENIIGSQISSKGRDVLVGKESEEE